MEELTMPLVSHENCYQMCCTAPGERFVKSGKVLFHKALQGFKKSAQVEITLPLIKTQIEKNLVKQNQKRPEKLVLLITGCI